MAPRPMARAWSVSLGAALAAERPALAEVPA
jgi:hypothetical protein